MGHMYHVYNLRIMPTYCKIPWKVREKKGVAVHRWVIFGTGLVLSVKLASKLEDIFDRKACPMVGKIKYKGKNYYYCMYGIVEDNSIYTTKKVAGQKTGNG